MTTSLNSIARMTEWCFALLLCFFCLHTGNALADAYNAPLPAELSSDMDLCRYVPCSEVLPEATEFTPRQGNPLFVEGFAQKDGERTRVGYVILSTDVTQIPGYSGKPIITLIGMDTQGHFTGVKILRHSEPILLLGIPESTLIKFNNQYIGHSVNEKIEIGRSRPDEGIVGMDAISGATVTVIAQNQLLMTSAAAVARQVGIMAPEQREEAHFNTLSTPLTWEQLVAEGSVRKLTVSREDVGLPPAEGEPFIELWFGYLNQPDVGRSVLGDLGWEQLMKRLTPEDNAIFVIRTAGEESFKGSGFVRGGLYDRILVRQDMDTFTFRDLDYINLYGLGPEDAPAYTESGIFIIRPAHQGAHFSAAYDWQLVFLGNRIDKATGQRSFVNFDVNYRLPEKYLEGGYPVVKAPVPTWVRVWQERRVDIIIFSIFLLAATAVYAFRDRLTRASTHKNKWPVNGFKYAIWIISVGYVGSHLMAQPSITQVLTWFHSILAEWNWTPFLSDPFIFLFWILIIITVFLWGRGFFCGWLCPFGSLSELLYKIASAVGLKRFQFKVPMRLHNRLKWIKYAIFLGLLAVSVFSMIRAEMLAEVEPFKTTFLLGVFDRPWPYGLYVAILLGLALFTERPFCKYLCPLGASLAMPSTFRWFGLRRKQECNSCKACANGCGSQSIDEKGRIDQRECMLCQDCMILYTDDHACPPLVKVRKQYEREGKNPGSISAEGYFIPLIPLNKTETQAARNSGPDPRMPSDPVVTPYPPGIGAPFRDLWIHLWPWTKSGFARHSALHIVGLVLAAASVLMWFGAIAGHLGPNLLIAGWLAWSAVELLVRMDCRPYVKEGPWWRSHFRSANWADMLCYVSFKNLLIGTVLFLILKSLGLLHL